MRIVAKSLKTVIYGSSKKLNLDINAIRERNSMEEEEERRVKKRRINIYVFVRETENLTWFNLSHAYCLHGLKLESLD